MMVVPLSRPARDYLVFFRREIARSVNWAGDPAKPVTSGPLGARLTPRKSFELWRETVSGQSPPWLAGRVPHRRSAARQPARSDPAPVRSHGNRTPARAGAAGTADRGAQPSRPQHSGTDPRRHHPEQGFGDRRRVLHQGDRRPHPRAGDGARSDHRRQLGAGLVSRPDQRGSRRLPRRQGGSRRHQRSGCADRTAGIHHGRTGDPRDDHQFGQIRRAERQSSAGSRSRPRSMRSGASRSTGPSTADLR